MNAVLASLVSEYRRYEGLGVKAMDQLTAEELSRRAPGDGNSVAILVWHVSGNLESRFTDFLTTDGEKPWRDRESEFGERTVGREEARAKWERGWSILFATLERLTEADLDRTVAIRGQELTVLEALHRSLAHAAYHVGQMVLLARSLKGGEWAWLSIPPGKSDDYNRNPTREKGPRRG